MIKNITISWAVLTILSLIVALIFMFPIYWAAVTSLKQETEVIDPDWSIFPRIMSIAAYLDVLTKSAIGTWYINSIATSVGITLLVILISMPCGYALSQIDFVGRKIILISVVVSIMVPGTALVIALFVLISDLNMINTWSGVILPQVLSPVCVIVYKQFFDQVPKELREASIIDGASELQILMKVYMPLNWGITTALALVTFIGAWNNFFWPFIMTTKAEMFTVPVAITSVNDAYGIFLARQMAVAMLAALPVVAFFLIFQKRVTQAIMLTSGIKG
ncbi:carbohydrate ABC transporter permease [Pelagibacteraceae bacterium]|nr:carbohydrate ABC transporter permease [Pelagibacteraceae bacterium]|tara:strand:+ start:2102 stop:2932 length:831 start_codon:yes stop_codon:yes gene_type:complete